MKVLLFELNYHELIQELTKNHFICETYAQDEYKEALAWQPDVKPIIAIVDLSKIAETILYKLKTRCSILGLHLLDQKIPDTKVNHCDKIITIENFQTAAPQIIKKIKQDFVNNRFVPLGDHKNILISEEAPLCIINGRHYNLTPTQWKICLILKLNPKKIWTINQLKYHLDLWGSKVLFIQIAHIRKFFFQYAGNDVIQHVYPGYYSLSKMVINSNKDFLKVKKETLDFLKEPYEKTSKLIRKLALKELKKLKNKESTLIIPSNRDKSSLEASLRYLIKCTHKSFSLQNLVQFLRHMRIQEETHE